MGWIKKETSPEDVEIRRIVRNSKVPILTLDSRWHDLFPESRKSNRIKELEYQLNELLKRQGKIADDCKEMKKLKQRLMEEIIHNISEDSGETGRWKHRKQEKSQKLILEINEKMEEYESELEHLPERLKRANEELLIESIRVWNEEMNENNEQIEAIAEWILSTREKLKENILRKQDMEIRNAAMYSYMHNLLGAKLMEEVDTKHNK